MKVKSLMCIVFIMGLTLLAIPIFSASIELVYVEGGIFIRGNDNQFAREKPAHQVTLNSFYIGKYPITQKQWISIMEDNPSGFQGHNSPVEGVNWYQAVEFCNKLSELEGLTPVYTINKSRQDTNNISNNDDLKWIVTANWNANGYRLPTEAEWEFAAKGGNESSNYLYSGSNNINQVAWYKDNSTMGASPVGKKNHNELGIYDMSGNVWEWCWDWFGQYSGYSVTNPRGPDKGSRAVLRGGSWYYYDTYSRITSRYRINRDYANYYNGFRLVRNAD